MGGHTVSEVQSNSKSVEADATFFVDRLARAAENMRLPLKRSLATSIARDPAFRNDLEAWAYKQGIANFGKEAFFDSVSRQIVYRLLGKVIFYSTLRRQLPELPEMSLRGITDAMIVDRLRDYFELARAIDYQAIFEEELTEKIPFPQAAVDELKDLVDDLDKYDFYTVPQDVVGQVFERLIPPHERHALGQYFTPEHLVDLTLAFCVRNPEDTILDPTCGTGTFLVRAYDRKRYLGQEDHEQLLSDLWGVDIARFPAELATINLYRLNPKDYASFPRILALDFFEIKRNDTFPFPSPRVGDTASEFIEEGMPTFDAAVGNFPYIRQELIERLEEGYKARLEEVIAENWLVEYPKAFDMAKRSWKEFEQAKEKGLDISNYFAEADLRLSGQADIYAYLFFHTSSHLQEGGRMGFVTSNAWLDVAYGYELQRFFLNNFKIVAILESRCEPWFEDSAVNTIVTILERCRDQEERDNHLVKFVKVKKRLQELIPWDMKMQAMKRWAGIDGLVDSIETNGSEHLGPVGDKYESPPVGHTSHEDEDFRIRVLKQGQLRDEVEQTRKTVKWGHYLRAPQVLFDVVKASRDRLVVLDDLARIEYGLKTGINSFFYLTQDRIDDWQIEEEFLVPVFRSPKEAQGILVSPSNLALKAFVCRAGKAELRGRRKWGALRYIEWGETQVDRNGTPWPQVPSVRGREFWYALPAEKPARLFWSKSYGVRLLQRYSESDLIADNRMYVVRERDEFDPKLVAALLNCSLTALMAETVGRVSLGEGALDVMVEDAREYLLVPDVNSFSARQKRQILAAFDRLLARPIRPIFEEITERDRQELDGTILEALGLDPKKYLMPIYEGLTVLVQERTELARMRTKAKRTKPKRDVARVKDDIVVDLLPEGPRTFPDQFIDPSIPSDRLKQVSLPQEPLKVGHLFFGEQELVTDRGYTYKAKSPVEAKYLIYAQRPGVSEVSVPTEAIDLFRTVKRYELYLRELRERLGERLMTRTLDQKMAERLLREIWAQHGLPGIESQ